MSADQKENIKTKYGAIAKSAMNAGGCGCGCGQDKALVAERLYAAEQLGDVPSTAALASLGCGNPTALAELAPGEVVLDLGSGGGLDVFLAAKRVGPAGKVYGLDMTDEMLALARENQKKAAVENVEFLKGDIEEIPLPDDMVDVIISNCVINLATDKEKVFREALRTLKPGGRLAVSDIVFQGDVTLIPEILRASIEAWTGCVAGALEERDYVEKLKRAGFEEISIDMTHVFDGSMLKCCESSFLPEGIRVASGFIRAKKPI